MTQLLLYPEYIEYVGPAPLSLSDIHKQIALVQNELEDISSEKSDLEERLSFIEDKSDSLLDKLDDLQQKAARAGTPEQMAAEEHAEKECFIQEIRLVVVYGASVMRDQDCRDWWQRVHGYEPRKGMPISSDPRTATPSDATATNGGERE